MSFGCMSNEQSARICDDSTGSHDSVSRYNHFVYSRHHRKNSSVLNQISLNASFGEFFSGFVSTKGWCGFCNNDLKFAHFVCFFEKRDKGIAEAQREDQIVLADMLLSLLGDRLPTHVDLIQYFSDLRQQHLLQIFKLLRLHIFDLHSCGTVISGLAMGHENICHHFFISGCDAFELLERNKRGNLFLRVNRQLKVFAGLVEKSEKALTAIPDDKIHLILGNQHAAKPD
jgi:hypothetical protein